MTTWRPSVGIFFFLSIREPIPHLLAALNPCTRQDSWKHGFRGTKLRSKKKTLQSETVIKFHANHKRMMTSSCKFFRGEKSDLREVHCPFYAPGDGLLKALDALSTIAASAHWSSLVFRFRLALLGLGLHESYHYW